MWFFLSPEGAGGERDSRFPDAKAQTKEVLGKNLRSGREKSEAALLVGECFGINRKQMKNEALTCKKALKTVNDLIN